MRALGVDPGTHGTGWAIVSDANGVEDVGILKVPRKITGQEAALAMIREIAWKPAAMFLAHGSLDCLVVEGQDAMNKKAGAQGGRQGEKIQRVALVAGGALGVLGGTSSLHLCPKPAQWKGTIEKKPHQARILRRELGWEFSQGPGYCYPTNPPVGKGLFKTDWKEIVDAIGLALWGLKQVNKPKARETAKQRAKRLRGGR